MQGYDITIPDLLLYVLYVAGGKLRSRTKLEKIVYLIQKEVVDLGLKFDINYYGPSSSQLRRWLVTLSVSNEIKEELKPVSETGLIHTYEYRLTRLGEIAAESMKEKLQPTVKMKIDEIVKTWKDKPKNEIIAYTAPLWFEERNIQQRKSFSM